METRRGSTDRVLPTRTASRADAPSYLQERDSAGTRPVVCLVCSSGGHFAELYRLQTAWCDFEPLWITFDSHDTHSILRDQRMIRAYGPTNRSLVNLARNAVLAWRVIARERPVAVVSTGAGVAVPFLLVARLRRIGSIYIESLARVSDLSLSGRIAYHIAQEFLVQWPGLTERYPRTRYEGRVL